MEMHFFKKFTKITILNAEPQTISIITRLMVGLKLWKTFNKRRRNSEE